MDLANIGRYTIKSEIARGGMATVYLAYDPYVKREVAIKLLPASLTHDPTLRGRFEREAQTVASLEHPAIVPVYDFGEEHGQPYLVMRYMPGGSLSQKIKANPLSLSEVSRIFTRLSSALDHVHALGIIHRDLKPANILFDLFNDAYLSDFGIAHIGEGNAAITGDGMVGTPAYMSPEQARGDAPLDGRSDIYSMGIIFFEALTGKQPYEATTPMGVAVKHLTAPIPKLSDYGLDLPHECQDILETAMAKDAKQRFPSATGMAQALMLIAAKTIKNPPEPAEDHTARISPPVQVGVPSAHKSPAKFAQARKPLPTTLPSPPSPSSADPSPLPPAKLQGAPARIPPAQPNQPFVATPQPADTPIPPLIAPGEVELKSHSGPPTWLWILLGVFGLIGICILAIVVILLANY